MRLNLAAAAVAVGLAMCPARAQDDRLHLFLHFTDAAPENFDTAVRVGLLLQADGFNVVDLRPVDVTVRTTTIRYFYPELRRKALALKEHLEALLAEQGIDDPSVRVQNFTFFAPKPRPNSLEVWFGSTQVAAGTAALDR